MGSDSRSAVVNSDLKTFSVQNLWISSTSVFKRKSDVDADAVYAAFGKALSEFGSETIKCAHGYCAKIVEVVIALSVVHLA